MCVLCTDCDLMIVMLIVNLCTLYESILFLLQKTPTVLVDRYFDRYLEYDTQLVDRYFDRRRSPFSVT